MPRHHERSINLSISPETTFALLITPSHIRGWWGAANAIVVPRIGGLWAAAWGEDLDRPDYVMSATIVELETPRRMLLAHPSYFAQSGEPPFDMSRMTQEFRIEPRPGGCQLTVRQSGFPESGEADDFYTACELGWERTLGMMDAYVSQLCPSDARTDSQGT